MASSKDHERIWLEPAGAPDRCWCEDNQWGDEGVEYVRATTAETQLAALTAERDEALALVNYAEDISKTQATQLAALTKRVGELEGALAPFVLVAKNVPDSFDDATIVSIGIDFTLSPEEVASIENHPRGGKLASNRSTVIVSLDGVNAGHFRAARRLTGGEADGKPS